MSSSNKRQRGRWTRTTARWPFGLPTVLCGACNGSGCPPGELQRVMNGAPLQGPARCQVCGGRGKVMDQTSKLTELCGHGLYRGECALCRSPSV